jgi:hypothetical protein
MKVWLANERFKTNEELMDGVKNWLGILAAPGYPAAPILTHSF